MRFPRPRTVPYQPALCIAVGIVRIAAFGNRPTWFHDIDLPSLDMNSITRDILGQLFGSFHQGMHLLFPADVPKNITHESQVERRLGMWRLAEAHGFESPAGYDAADLQHLWTAEITARRRSAEMRAAVLQPKSQTQNPQKLSTQRRTR